MVKSASKLDEFHMTKSWMASIGLKFSIRVRLVRKDNDIVLRLRSSFSSQEEQE